MAGGGRSIFEVAVGEKRVGLLMAGKQEREQERKALSMTAAAEQVALSSVAEQEEVTLS